jgi:DNA-binding PadR family transcriptional regulator
MSHSALEREILQPSWKVHILHHAQEGSIVGHWMMEKLREHGYRVSPGTPLPASGPNGKLGWLKRDPKPRNHRSKDAQPYRATAAGRRALRELEDRLRELIGEVYEKKH